MTTVANVAPPVEHWVRVWFGEHVIADYIAEPADAIRYQAGMTRRFASLRVTIERADAVVAEDASDS